MMDGNGTKSTFTPEQLALMRGMTKMMLAGIQEPRMYPDTEGSEEYNPNNPITIGSMDHYGRNYCIPPHDYIFDCAIYMANNEDMFVTRKYLMQNDGGVWSTDCVSVTRLMYKNWLDKDVYNFYVKEGFPMAKVSTQWYMLPSGNKGAFPTDTKGNLDTEAIQRMIKEGTLPPGTVIHADNFIGPKNDGVAGQDGRGDTHQKLYVGMAATDQDGNIVRYTGAPGQRDPYPLVLNSRGGEYGRPLELQNLFTADNVTLYATPPHRNGIDQQTEWGQANATQ